MAISYIGSASAQTTSCTPPTHQAGDLFICFAYRDGNTTAPSLPSGWTNINSGGANTNSHRIGWKIASSSSDTCTGWTNAGGVMLHVYRGANSTTPIGGGASGGASSSSVAYNTFTLTDTGGTSWVAGFAGHRSVDTTAMGTAPTGMTNRTNTAGTSSDFASHDTNGTVSSWSTKSVSVGGTASGWRSYTVEIRNETVPSLTGQTVTQVSNTSGTPKVTTDKASGTVYMVCVANNDTPSVAQIKAGQNSSGSAAINAQSQSVTVSGVQTFTTVTGLTTDTPYDFWFVHNTTTGDSSAVKADFTPTLGALNAIQSFDAGTVTELGGTWTNSGNAGIFDTTWASATIADGGTATLAFNNFGFNIPTGATLLGMEVKVSASASVQSTSITFNVAAFKNVPGGTGDAANIQTLSNFPAWTSYDTFTVGSTTGGMTSVWGSWTGGTPTVSDVNSSNFGVWLIVENTDGASRTVYIDGVAVAIYYSYVPDPYPSDTGWLNPSSNNDGGSGAGLTNPTNAYSVNGTYATSAVSGVGFANHNFGGYSANIPAGATIVGVEARAIVKQSTADTGVSWSFNIADDITNLVDSFGWLNEVTNVGTSDTTLSIGWPGGVFVPTRTQVNDSNFGVMMSTTALFTGTLYVDAIQLRVWYYPPDTADHTLFWAFP